MWSTAAGHHAKTSCRAPLALTPPAGRVRREVHPGGGGEPARVARRARDPSRYIAKPLAKLHVADVANHLQQREATAVHTRGGHNARRPNTSPKLARPPSPCALCRVARLPVRLLAWPEPARGHRPVSMRTVSAVCPRRGRHVDRTAAGSPLQAIRAAAPCRGGFSPPRDGGRRRNLFASRLASHPRPVKSGSAASWPTRALAPPCRTPRQRRLGVVSGGAAYGAGIVFRPVFGALCVMRSGPLL